MENYIILISTNKRSYCSRDLINCNIKEYSKEDAIEQFWLALEDAAKDIGKYLDYDGNKAYTRDIVTDETDGEYYLIDTIEAMTAKEYEATI